jgi:isopentenyl-diphosphate delta-isomerase
MNSINPNNDLIVYVNEKGEPTGETAQKLDAHTANTRLHLAFSCYVFNTKGEFLVTQRAHGKKVWPDVWTNSVCGHPAPGESMVDAMKRRLDYEVGLQARDYTVMLPQYTYKTPPYNGIIEHEFCPVYVAVTESEPKPNPDEVEDYTWMAWDEYTATIKKDTNDTWSWWCKDQLKHLENNTDFQNFLESFKK